MIARKAPFQAILASRPWLVLYWGLLVLTIAWLYWPFLCGAVPAFRDAFHFYYPLEFWLAGRADAGQFVPHFNPYDGTGSNLVGETSSGLCYPGRILWWIPGLTVAQRLGVVLAVHTLIAAAGAAYAAARLNLSSSAGCLAATAYAFSGAVLFQHVNPVYLIGAAWTPWLLAECWVLAHQVAPHGDRESPETSPAPSRPLRPRMGVWVAAAALMLLGGDPQATANAGIVALLAIATRWAATGSWRFFGRQLVWLTCAVGIVTGLTAVQWIPARHWLTHSHRAVAAQSIDGNADGLVADVPQLLQPLAETLQQPSAKSAVAERKAGGTYAFSIAPWHLLTLLWGTAGGHFLPEHTRWLQSFGAEPRMWTTSLTIGLLPMLWIVAGWSNRSTRRGQRFLIVVAAVSGLAMLGNYAPVWLLRQACHAVGAEEWSHVLPGDEVGSVYWCFTKLVPGYSAFRYPGKWSVWFACALALSAADALDRRDEKARTLICLCTVIAVLSVLAALAVAWLHWMPGGKQVHIAFSNWLATAPPDAWLGRPDAAAVLQLWLQAAIVAAAISTICGLFIRFSGQTQRLRTLVLLLTLVELAWTSNRWLVAVDPSALDLSQAAPLAENIDAEREPEGRLLERLWADAGEADWESWSRVADREQSQLGRVEHECSYQTVFRLSKLHLLFPRQANLSGLMSLTPRSLTTVRHTLAQADDLRADNPALDEALAWLGVTQRLTAGKRLTWQVVPGARPIVEMVADAEAGEGTPTGRCVVEHFDADHLRVRVSSSRDSRLIVRLLQDGGWSATLAPSDGPTGQQPALHRVPASSHLGLFQSLSVPAGNWTIKLSYCAPGWRLGLAVTLSTLVACLAFAVSRYAKRKHPESGHLA